MWGQALDGERTGDSHLLAVLVGLVVEHLEVGVPFDGGVDLLPRHSLADVRVVGDRLQHDVRDPLVHEPMADVAGRRGRRESLGRELGLLRSTLD